MTRRGVTSVCRSGVSALTSEAGVPMPQAWVRAGMTPANRLSGPVGRWERMVKRTQLTWAESLAITLIVWVTAFVGVMGRLAKRGI
jgi:hypothetical protein